ncbi:outer membrane protein assembly factor BamA, partial [Actibacterium sp.]|uniref:outer membrane protein assembly factor BamA n=1 Tax=Actibacterium sp. TaxID=1872125 RepID=UPI003563907C
RLALQKGLNFIRVEPRISRNDRDLTLDIDFAINRGPRIFVERIDIEGNVTTLDSVIRRQFTTVEGDPFNARAIREAASRIRALGFFATSNVAAREGSSPDTVVIGVEVEEQPTGTLSFGLNYSVASGVGAVISFSETNFLGRGQYLSFSYSSGLDSSTMGFSFAEPAFLGRDVRFSISASQSAADNLNSSLYQVSQLAFSTGLEFPAGEFSRIGLRYSADQTDMYNYTGDSTILAAEAALGKQVTSSIGYTWARDTRGVGLNPEAGVLFRFTQDFAGVGGDSTFVRTEALVAAEKLIFSEEVTLRAEFEGGLLSMISGDSRAPQRYFANAKIRGFDLNGIGPRDLASTANEALGGNAFAVARFEAEFPVGLPDEYGITAGVFADFGSVWMLDNTNGGAVDDGFHLRSAIGFSVFWDTAIGPLRFNFSRALMKEAYDRERNFDLTISTRF